MTTMRDAVAVNEHGEVVREGFSMACVCRFDVGGRFYIGPINGLEMGGRVVCIPEEYVSVPQGGTWLGVTTPPARATEVKS